MKKLLLLIILVFAAKLTAIAQLGVAYHQSSLPFVGVNYQIGERFIPEARVGVNYFMEDVSVELAMQYAVLRNEHYQFYTGVGVNNQDQSTYLVVPIGINIYPFEAKQFGFHLEVAPLINDPSILRGSWGIRYRFLK